MQWRMSRSRTSTTAKRFYEDTLGLEPVDSEGEEVVVYKSGNSTMNVYRSQYRRNQQGHRRDMVGR